MEDPVFLMLRFLSVRHLAVIDQLEIEFQPGLNVVTGETGAGKSMLVQALDLLIGGRASADLVRTGEDVASVQAIFERADGREVIVRREISAQGRSRAFIDDTLATSGALKELGAALVELHGQHEHQALLDPAEHLTALDDVAECEADVALVAARFATWRDATAARDRTRLDAREKVARIDLVSFQLEEIDRVAPLDGEDDALAAERAILANADRLGRLSTEAYAMLYEGDHAVMTGLGVVWKRLVDLDAVDGRFHPYVVQRQEVDSRLEDLAFFLRSYGADLDASPARLQDVEDRLAAIERLKKKHGPSLAHVLDRQRAFRAELDALQASDERTAALDAAADAAARAFLDVARELSAARALAGKRLGRDLERALGELAMPNARVDVRIESVAADSSAWSARGVDRVEFFLSPNPGEDVRPLSRIASGGELSRVMLALRTLGATGGAGNTIIFDEVDAGIGGAAADAVGARLQRLASVAQVLCITHLPQIAARGDAHFAIEKHVRAGRTVTAVERLDAGGREREIARMIAGAEISDLVIASARDLLQSRQRSEQKEKGESESLREAKAKGKRRGG